MKIETSEVGNAIIAFVRAERIDAAAAIAFKETLCAKCKGGPGRIVLDLCDVNFIDSSGLGAIIGAMKMLAPAQKLELSGLQPAVDRVFALTRMDQLFALHASVESALDPDAHTV